MRDPAAKVNAAHKYGRRVRLANDTAANVNGELEHISGKIWRFRLNWVCFKQRRCYKEYSVQHNGA